MFHSVLFRLVPSCSVLFRLVPSRSVLFCLVPFCFVLFHLGLSCFVLFCLVLSCFVSFYLVLSCFVLRLSRVCLVSVLRLSCVRLASVSVLFCSISCSSCSRIASVLFARRSYIWYISSACIDTSPNPGSCSNCNAAAWHFWFTKKSFKSGKRCKIRKRFSDCGSIDADDGVQLALFHKLVE